MSPFYDDPSLAGERPSHEGLFDAQLRLPLQPRSLVETIVKRDGRQETYDSDRIAEAIRNAAKSVSADDEPAESFARAVTLYLGKRQRNRVVTVDQVHDAIERVLGEMSAHSVGAAYAHRYRRTPRKGDPPRAYSIDTFFDELESTENAPEIGWNPAVNHNAIRRCAQSHYAAARVFSWDVIEAHRVGDIHVHALDALDIFETIELSAAGDLGHLSHDDAHEWLLSYCNQARNLAGNCSRLIADIPLEALEVVTGALPETAVRYMVAWMLNTLSVARHNQNWLRLRETESSAQSTSSHLSGVFIDLLTREGDPRTRLQFHISHRTMNAGWPDATPRTAVSRCDRFEAIEFHVQPDQTLLPYGACEPHAVSRVAGRVTINLAHAAEKSPGIELFLRELERLVELAHRAHAQRYQYLLPLTTRGRAPEFESIAQGIWPFLIGISGLHECVQRIAGRSFTQSENALELAEEILARFQAMCAERPVNSQAPLLLAPTRDAAVRDRFDALDTARFGSTHVIPSHTGVDFPQIDLDPMTISHLYGRLCRFIDQDHVCELEIAKDEADPEEVLEWVRRTFTETPCEAVVLRSACVPEPTRKDS